MKSTFAEVNMMSRRQNITNVDIENSKAHEGIHENESCVSQKEEITEERQLSYEQKEYEEKNKCLNMKLEEEEFLYLQFRQYYLENERNANDLQRLRRELAEILESNLCIDNSTRSSVFTGTRTRLEHVRLPRSFTNVFNRRVDQRANNPNFYNRFNHIIEVVWRQNLWLLERILQFFMNIWIMLIIPFINNIFHLIAGNPIIALFVALEIYTADDTLMFILKLALVAFVWKNFIRHRHFFRLAIVPAEHTRTSHTEVMQSYSFTGRLINYRRFAHANGSISWYVKATYVLIKIAETFLASIIPMYDVRKLETELSTDEIVRGRGARSRT